jgi:hypothetical protein
LTLAFASGIIALEIVQVDPIADQKFSHLKMEVQMKNKAKLIGCVAIVIVSLIVGGIIFVMTKDTNMAMTVMVVGLSGCLLVGMLVD